jgi:hypothetical protein
MTFAPFVLADVAISELSSTDYLFWVNDGAVYRGRCPAGTRFFDRDTCGLDTLHAGEERVLAAYRATLAPNLASDQKAEAQVWATIQSIDDKLLEILSTPAGTPHVTDQQLDAARAAYDQAYAAAQPLRDQVARIQIALAAAPGDGELLAQLGVTRTALAPKQAAENTALATLNQLRKAYAAERGSSDQAAYAELVKLRSDRESQLEHWRSELDRELKDITNGEALITKLEDRSFAWPIDTDPNDVAERFERSYPRAERDDRTLRFTAAERYRVHFELTDTRPIEDVECRVSSQKAHGYAFEFQKLRGNQILASASLKYDWSSQGLIELDFGAADWTRKPLTDNGFFGVPAPGTWDVSFHYLSDPEGPLPIPFEPLACALVLKQTP